MPSAMNGQELREDSPPSQPEIDPVDTQLPPPDASGAAADRTAPESSTPHGEEALKSEVPRDDAGRFAPKASKPTAPDSVEDAIDRLARKATKPEPDPSKPPGKGEVEKAKQPEKPAAPQTDEGLKTRTNDDLDAPPEEKAAWRQHTRERFDKVLTAAKEARAELEKVAPLIEDGREYTQLLDSFELRQDIGFVPPEHIAGLIKTQAAVNRGLLAIQQGRIPAPQDVKVFTEFAGAVDTLRGQLGLAAPAVKAPDLKPFEGELPADLHELVQVYGIDEKRVRLLAAMEAKAPAAPVATTPAAAPAAPEPQPARPVGPDMDLLYGRKLFSELHAEGVQNPSEQMRVLVRHPATKQEVIKRFPGVTLAEVPAIFDSLDPATRYDVLKSVHKALSATKVPVRPPQPPPPATNQRGIQATAPARRTATQSADANAVDSAIDYLAGN